MRTVSFILFVTISTVGLAAGHYYLWNRLARRTHLSKRWRRFLAALIAVLGVGLVGTWALSRAVGRDALAVPMQVGFAWMGFLFYAVLFLGLWDIGRLATLLLRRRRATTGPADAPEPQPSTGLQSPDRRRFLARSVATATVLGAGGVSALGLSSALGDITKPTVEVKLDRLPPALSGYRIALLSDLHIGLVLDGSFLKRVVAEVNAMRPDLVAIVGDLVDASVERIGRDIAQLQQLRARDGVFFSTGNHEYYVGADSWVAYLRKLGVNVLLNERTAIGDRGASFDLAGLPDRHGHWFSQAHKPDISKVNDGRDPERELVVLAHQPSQVDDAADGGAGLQLSGHTHGGQLWPFGTITRLSQPYLSGLHLHRGRTQIYVTRGTGFWGPPMRVLAPAEITEIVLT